MSTAFERKLIKANREIALGKSVSDVCSEMTRLVRPGELVDHQLAVIDRIRCELKRNAKVRASGRKRTRRLKPGTPAKNIIFEGKCREYHATKGWRSGISYGGKS